MRRILAASGLVAMLAAGLAGTAVPALAAPASDHACSGAVCLTISPSSTKTLAYRRTPVTLGYSLAVTGGTANVAVTVHDSSGLSPVPSSTKLDGIPIASSQVSVTGANLTATLPTVAAGSHELTFSTGPVTTASSSSYATALVKDGLGGPVTTATSASNQVQLQQPDFKIERFDPPLSPLTPGGEANAAVSLYGPNATPARLDLAAPAGFTVISVGDSLTQKALTCGPSAPPAGRTSCLGDFSGFHDLNILIRANSTDAVGRTGSLTVTILPLGIADATPSNNTVHIPLKVVGTAAVVAAITPQVKAIYLNRYTNYTITVTNQGPDTATNVQTSIVLMTNAKNVFSLAVPRPLVLNHNGNPGFPGYASWHIGTLGKGQSVSVTVTVRGSQVAATALLGVGDFQSDTLNPKQCPDRACNFAASRTLIVTPVPAVQTGAGGPGLPATGGPVRVPLGLGLLSLLSGALLLAAGRRRTS